MNDNDKNYYMSELIGLSGIGEVRNPLYISSDYNPLEYTPRRQFVGLYFNTDSKYDETLGNVQEAIQLGLTVDDLRARKQSGWGMAANALVNNLVIAGTTAISGTIGLVDGIFEAISTGDASKLWDNDITNWSVNTQNAAREAMPIYRGSDYEDKSIWSKMGTGIFWADLFLNLGFTEGMLIPGMGVSKLLLFAPKILRAIIPSLVSSIGEASQEAVNERNDEVINKTKLANQRYNELAEKIQSPVALGILDNTYRLDIANIEEDATNAGNFVFASNIALLTMTNTIEFGDLFSRGFNTAKRIKGVVKRTGNQILKENLGVAMALATGKKLLNAFSEGFEEVSLAIISRTPSEFEGLNRFNDSKFNIESRQLAADIWSALGQSYSETMNDPNTQVEFASGFLTGALGVPVLRKSKFPIGLENNIALDLRSAYKDWQKRNQWIDSINDRLSDDKKIKAYYEGLTRKLAILGRKNTALEKEDAFDYKTAESEGFISDAMMFDDAGLMDYLRSIINDSVDMSDEGIDAIINETSLNGEGPFMFNGNKMPRDEVRSILKDQIDLLNQKLDSYIKDKQLLETLFPNMSEEGIKAALYLKLQGRDFGDRYSTILSEVVPKVNILLKESYAEELKKPLKEDGALYTPLNEGLFIINWNINKKFRDRVTGALGNKNSELTYDERNEVSKKLVDLTMLDKNMSIYRQALDDILSDPKKADTLVQLSIDKAQNKYRDNMVSVAKLQLEEAVSFSDVEDIISKVEDQYRSYVDNDEVLNSIDNQTVKDYKDAKIFKSELDLAIDKSDYTDELKKILHDIANLRFSTNDNLSDLINLDLVTDSSVTLEDGTVIDDDSLAPFILQAKNALENRSKLTEEAKDNPSKPTVDTDTTGSSETGTVPTTSKQKFAKLLDLIKDSLDTETVNNIIAPIIKLAEEQLKASTSTKEEGDISDINKLINTILNHVESLPEADNTEFRTKLDAIIDELNSLLPESSPEVSDLELLDATLNDLENQAVQDSQPVSYYRSDLTLFEIDPLRLGQFVPYIPSKESVKLALSKIDFEYINKGNVKVEDTIELRQEDIEGDTFTFMYHNNHIVGVLPLSTNQRYKGIKGVNERLSGGERVTLTVSKVMLGKYKYDRGKTLSVKDVASLPSDVKLGIMKPTKGRLGMTTNTLDVVEPVYDELHSDGKVYLLLPNSRGTLSPKLLRVKHFNQEEFPLERMRDSGNTRAIEIDNILQEISKATNPDQITDLFVRLGKVLHLGNDFHMNLVYMGGNTVLTIRSKKGRKNIVVERGSSGGLTIGSDGAITYDLPLRVDPATIYKQMLDYLYSYNTPFNIQASKINKGTYNTDLLNDNILYTHITDAEMVGSWFTTTWYDDNGVEQKAVNPRGQFNPANNKEGTNVTVGGKLYYVDKGVVYDTNENEVPSTAPNYELVKDLALAKEIYGDKLNGDNLSDGKALLPSGKGLDIVNQRYLTSAELLALKDSLAGRPSKVAAAKSTLARMLEDYKKVKRDSTGRPDTSENENGESVYRVMEEDGKYHEYRRVHSIIGSNWIEGESLTLEEAARRAENGANALKWGNMIDDICRAFFSNETVNRPPEMSESAFNTVISHLKQIKATLERNGELFLTNRIVVFKKYPDGTRVAGELDVLSYNPITGSFNIYDFKTSKRPFWVTGNAIDLYRTKGKMQTRSDYEQHSLQLSAYKNMFDSSYESSVGTLAIMPFVLSYSENKSLNQVTPQKGIVLPYNSSVSIGATREVKPVTPPVTNPANAVLLPEPASSLVTFSAGDKVSFTTSSDVVTGTVVRLSSSGKLVTILRDSDNREVNVSLSTLSKAKTATSTKAVESKGPKVAPTLEKEKSSSDKKDIQQGDSSYFELNGEVVTGPTIVIGNIQGYEIRMYKQQVTTQGLGGAGAGTAYDYYAVFPNGATGRIVHFQNLTDELAGRVIIDALNKNLQRTMEYINKTTKLGSYLKQNDKKLSLRDAANRLNGTNKLSGRRETNIAEEPKDPKVDLSGKLKLLATDSTEYNPIVYKSWEELTPAERLVLLLLGVTQDWWESVPLLESRQSKLNCF